MSSENITEVREVVSKNILIQDSNHETLSERPGEGQQNAMNTTAMLLDEPAPPDCDQPRDGEEETANNDQVEQAEIDPCLYADSTSLGEMRVFLGEDGGKLLGDPAVYKRTELFCNGCFPETARTDAEMLDHAKDICLAFNRQLTKATNLTTGTYTEYAIAMGKALLKTKKLVKKCNLPWKEWTEENLPGMSIRTVENYMLLARRRDAHAYDYLGMDRLLTLISATKDDDDEEDPIGSFLRKFGLECGDDPDRTTVEEFKEAVDAGIAAQKLQKAGISVDLDLARRLLKSGGTISKRMLDEVRAISSEPEKVQEYFDQVITNKGKLPQPTIDAKAETFTAAVDGIAEKLAKLMSTRVDVASKINVEAIDKLDRQIRSLKEIILKK